MADYTTPQNVRDILGVTSDEASDESLDEYIKLAEKIVMKHIQIPIIDEEMTGNIDGTNNTFSVEHAFIADTTGDKTINTLDFTIYLWTDGDDPRTKSAVTPNTFDPTYGIFFLSSAPRDTTYEKITCTYSYYTCQVDWDIIDWATRYYAAMLWVQKELFLVPSNVYLGQLKTISIKPWEYFRNEFNRMIDLLVAKPMDKVTYNKMVFDPRGGTKPDIETTYADEMAVKGRTRTKEMGGTEED